MNGRLHLALVALLAGACTSKDLPADEVIRTRPDLGGNTLLPDGAVIGPDGEVIRVDGGRGSLDGAIVSSDGAVVGSDGATAGSDGSTRLPDGAIPGARLVRFAHMVPDGPSLRLCFGPPGFPAPIPPLPEPSDSPSGVAFRDVAEYVDFPNVGFDDIEIRAFDTAVLDAAGDCGTGATPLARLTVRNVSSLTGSHYTIAVTGLANPSATSCPGTDGPEPCGSAEGARLAVFEDSPVDPGNTRLRLIHSVPNLRRSIGVCHDPDGSGGGAAPVQLIAPIPLGSASTYASRASLTSGSLRFFAASGCAGTQIHELVIPTPGALVSGMPTVDVNETYGAGEVSTLFAAGIRGSFGGGTDEYVPVLDLP